jgi:serine/threonine protein phosphatase PrpC
LHSKSVISLSLLFSFRFCNRTTLEPNDEFILLGCDGIWDCLTNQAAVDYVRARIDSKTPTEIGIEMLNDIISEDPRVTQGIGGDNMTIMIIDLQPRSRSYRVADASPI